MRLIPDKGKVASACIWEPTPVVDGQIEQRDPLAAIRESERARRASFVAAALFDFDFDFEESAPLPRADLQGSLVCSPEPETEPLPESPAEPHTEKLFRVWRRANGGLPRAIITDSVSGEQFISPM